MAQENGTTHDCTRHDESFANIKDDLQDLRNHHKPLFREYDESRVFRQKASASLSEVPLLVKFKEQAKVLGVVGSLIFGASFIYTKSHITDSNQNHRDMRELVRVEKNDLKSQMAIEVNKIYNLVDNNENAINSLESSQLILNEKLARIDGSVFRIESRLGQLVDILADAEKIPDANRLNFSNGTTR